ncbi:MAG: fdhD, partial [Rhizobacter sp.]|nr:fdhD [Rhizobacter sp.]
RAFASLKQRRRAMEGRSGCGLCGIDSLTAFDFVPAMNRALQDAASEVPVSAILAAIGDLGNHQPLNDRTGGCHAAGWATPDGTLVLVQEDVGRHNALDKLIGRLAVMKLLGTPGFAVVSSRASYELARKCAAVGIPLLAAISAPSSLAIDLATQTGLQLYGFVRNAQAVRYDGGTRG